MHFSLFFSYCIWFLMTSSRILSWIRNLMPYKPHEILVMRWSTLIISSNDLNFHYWMDYSKLEEKIKLNNFPLYLDNLTLHNIIFYSHQQKELDSLFRLIHVCRTELELIDAPSDQSSFPLISPECCSRSELKKVCTCRRAWVWQANCGWFAGKFVNCSYASS